MVNPTMLNVQVPFETAAGMQPLVVSTAGGTASGMNVAAAAASPSVFILDVR
jgi:uncharacterized protein (TIGR03437 family)